MANKMVSLISAIILLAGGIKQSDPKFNVMRETADILFDPKSDYGYEPWEMFDMAARLYSYCNQSEGDCAKLDLPIPLDDLYTAFNASHSIFKNCDQKSVDNLDRLVRDYSEFPNIQSFMLEGRDWSIRRCEAKYGKIRGET